MQMPLLDSGRAERELGLKLHCPKAALVQELEGILTACGSTQN